MLPRTPSFETFPRTYVYAALIALLGWPLAGCSSESPSAAPVDPDSQNEVINNRAAEVGGEKRSETCLEMQDAACAYYVEKCGSATAGACSELLYSRFCIADDEVLASCRDGLKDLACNEPTPPSCDAPFDPEPAQRLCNQFVDKLCAHRVSCGFVTDEECRKDVSDKGLECSAAAGIGVDYETCLSDARTRACDAAEPIPESCFHVFYK